MFYLSLRPWFVLVTAAIVPVLIGLPPAASAATGVPFTDPASDGYIGFCDLHGHNVTGGSVMSKPFVWEAVSSVAAPSGYTGRGQNASLNIYQVRPEVLPAEWSGDQLTSASFFTDPRYPTAVATYQDDPLKVITTEFPPKLHGLYQLRMQFGKEGYGVYSGHYPTTTIQVSGGRWHVVQGGLVDCQKARATSLETETNHVPQVPKHTVAGLTPVDAPAADRAGAGAARNSPAAGSSGRSTSEPLHPVAQQTIDAPIAGASTTGGGVSGVLIGVIALAALIALGLAGLWLRGRRSTT